MRNIALPTEISQTSKIHAHDKERIKELRRNINLNKSQIYVRRNKCACVCPRHGKITDKCTSLHKEDSDGMFSPVHIKRVGHEI